MRITGLMKDFLDNEKMGGIVLIICTIVSLILANSSIGESYAHFWHAKVGTESVEYWINDGLMAIFFLLIGLELEREIYIGELSDLKKASLPIFGALGGMLVPAAIFLIFNFGTASQSGAGIPMATDIAFAVGVLSLLGKRVPVALTVFLMALAVIDDLGAILIIAFFYTSSLNFIFLFCSLGIFGVLLLLNRLKIYNLIPYLVGGVAMWYCMLHSGVHATITGVLLAFAIPFQNGEKKSISYRLQHFIHKPVSFLILPLFALANTCVVIDSNWTESLTHDSGLGILCGLVLGKPLGIMLVCFLAIKLGWSSLPHKIKWKHLLGVGMLAGIGFTMSIFITILAFDQQELIDHSKIAILIASLVSGISGFIYLKVILSRNVEGVESEGGTQKVGLE